MLCVAVVGTLAGLSASNAQTQQGNGQHGGGHHDGRATYQRHRFDWKDKGHGRRRDDFKRSWNGPQMSSGWFQRPYPYHLDYYRMKYCGSYAPYFGNLYGTPFGTPAVVYGGWGPGTGDWGPNVQPQGVEGSVWAPYALPQGAVIEQGAGATPNGTTQQGNESLPAPSK
jgi:hypothetical protein